MNEPVDTTTTCAVDEELEAPVPEEADEAAPAPVDEAPVPVAPLPDAALLDEAELPDEAEAPDEADTCWPTARSSDATVPAVVDTSVAPFTAVWAAVT